MKYEDALFYFTGVFHVSKVLKILLGYFTGTVQSLNSPCASETNLKHQRPLLLIIY